MDTLKTSVVVVLLLAGLYCVYISLNSPERSTQDNVAWEAGTEDPALKIELGVPEPGDASAPPEPNLPAKSWGDPPQSAEPTANYPTAGYPTEDEGASSPSLANRPGLGDQGLGDRHSLPIPEPATPAAPAIAAPDLIETAVLPTTGSNELPPLGTSQDPDGASAIAEASPTQGAVNELRDPTNSANGLESPTSRSGESSRYGDYTPLRDESASEVEADADTPAPAISTQANVNDVDDKRISGLGANTFQSAMEAARTKIAAEAWKDALIKLSAYYNDPSFSPAETTQLVDLLDPLAAKVIYSAEHLIEPAYQSQAGDTLMNIADRHQIPWQLLANINGIENPETLLAGRELKVVRGPFRAEVSLSKNELTLFVGELYAGRFTVSIGNDPAPLPGQYQINDKQPGRTYYAGDGQTIPIDDPNNPFGRVWLDLGNNLSIHGSPPNGASPGQGCIALSALDAGDVFGILSKGSSVVISR